MVSLLSQLPINGETGKLGTILHLSGNPTNRELPLTVSFGYAYYASDFCCVDSQEGRGLKVEGRLQLSQTHRK